MSEPKGGTELQLGFLQKYVDNELLDHFQICTSIPGKVPIDKNKINILWQKNNYNQPNIQPWFSDKKNHDQYDWYIFNSHWSAEKYRMMYGLPLEKCHVIKNAISHFPERQPYKEGDRLRLIFQPTPWRGLNVLLGAMDLLKDENIELDVYSSCNLYGSEFAKNNDETWKKLYEQARSLPNVNYLGNRPNEFILNKITNYHMFAYPCIWEETSCISAIECMSAGLYTITTNYGALFETCADFPVYINYDKDYKKLAYKFAYAIKHLMCQLHRDYAQDHLELQQNYMKRFYSWDSRKTQWTNFLIGAKGAKK
jgi:glycosyltransferase involved in cell wall biosynthesis|tara:strand:+ start:302 stop:1234 length:933 start_codon:yes stop_codon:yes gene_type:complete